MSLDASGHPVLAYYDGTTQNLRLLHCNDSDCAGGDDTTTSPDTGYQVGGNAQLILDNTGMPVVTYLDGYNLQLKLLHCGAPDCTTSNSIVTLDTNVTGITLGAVALDSAGNPVVAYLSNSGAGSKYKVVHCGDANCVGPNVVSMPITGTIYGSPIALDAAGNPVTGYYNASQDSLGVLHCGDHDCSASNIIAAPDVNLLGSFSASMTLDPAGHPVMSYYVHYGADGDLRILRCGNAYCTTGNVISVPDSVGDVGFASQLRLDAAGRPIVSYSADAAGVRSVRILHCVTTDCLSKGETPVPNSTSTPTPCPGTCPRLDFSISVDMVGGNSNTCDSSGTPTSSCQVAAGEDFLVRLHLKSLPADLPGGDYFAYDAWLNYSGVTSDGTFASIDFSPWPDCQIGGPTIGSDEINFFCTIGPGAPESTYTGVMATIRLTCAADGTITLVHAAGNTDLADRSQQFYYDPDGTEALTVQCVPPQAYPGDTDGDGCPDAKEMGMNPMLGGRRNFLNPWDYSNPSHDHQNRVDDILLVMHQFHKDSGNPAYNVDTDRTYVGPNLWNLGPPNGQQRVDDILNAVHHYHHDCS